MGEQIKSTPLQDREKGEQVFSLQFMSYRETGEQTKSISHQVTESDDDSLSSDDPRGRYNSLEQRDSDVIIESSDEEILEDDSQKIVENWS
jgi:hypothetical protein